MAEILKRIKKLEAALHKAQEKPFVIAVGETNTDEDVAAYVEQIGLRLNKGDLVILVRRFSETDTDVPQLVSKD